MTVAELEAEIALWRNLYPNIDNAEVEVKADEEAGDVRVEVPNSSIFRIVVS